MSHPPPIPTAGHRVTHGAAQATVWWDGTPALPGHRTGCIGQILSDTMDDSVAMLEAAAAVLAGRGCTLAIAPMDRTTWHAHRVITWTDGSPPLPYEPAHPEWMPGALAAAHFSPISGYSTSWVDLDSPGPAWQAVRDRLLARGLTVDAFNTDAPLDDLAAIHAVSVTAFSENFLYTPVGLEEFLALYTPGLSRIHPAFVRIARHTDPATGLRRPVGFVFGVPVPGAVIVKTVAVLPEAALRGLGLVLTETVHETAIQSGIMAAIHAFQHDDNPSLRITARRPHRVIRRYTLYSRPLP